MTQFSIISAHAALAGVVDERREDALGLAQVLGDAAARVAADERADRDAAELRGGVDAGAQVGDGRPRARRGRGEVVVVVRERGERRGRARRGCSGRARPPRGRSKPSAVHVARGERPVAEAGPGRELERLVAVRSRPGGDLLERALGHAGGEEAELHRGAALPTGAGHVDPARLARGREHGVGELRRAHAVGERRHPVDGRLPLATDS